MPSANDVCAADASTVHPSEDERQAIHVADRRLSTGTMKGAITK
jgi:hypothetical protein